MGVVINEIKVASDFSPEQTRWKDVPVAVAVDIDPAACQIDPTIRPLRPAGQQPRLFGRALTVQVSPPDFGAVLHAINLIGPGDVLVIAGDGVADTALIGGIVSGAIRGKGAVGVICDGAVRDVAELAAFNDFSVFTRHITPRGPTSAAEGTINGPVSFGGQQINPGDLILGDDDGLVRLTADQGIGFIEQAEAKLSLEEGWIKGLKDGRTAQEVFGI